MSDNSNFQVKSEILTQLRHLGTVRFSLFGVFFAIIVGMFVLYTSETAQGLSYYKILIKCASVGLCVIFIIFEILSSRNYVRLIKELVNIDNPLALQIHGKTAQRKIGPVTILCLFIYFLVTILWVFIPLNSNQAHQLEQSSYSSNAELHLGADCNLSNKTNTANQPTQKTARLISGVTPQQTNKRNNLWTKDYILDRFV